MVLMHILPPIQGFFPCYSKNVITLQSFFWFFYDKRLIDFSNPLLSLSEFCEFIILHGDSKLSFSEFYENTNFLW